MASAAYSSHPEIPLPGNLQDHRCPACEALYRDTEELIRKVEAAETYAEAMKQEALAQEAERDRLLRLLFSSDPGEA
jgi:uncharacterized C2H2 Zn-finger protein